jgi:hypothetical protein
MKAFVVACLAIVVIAVGAALVLEKYQTNVNAAFTTTGVRI